MRKSMKIMCSKNQLRKPGQSLKRGLVRAIRSECPCYDHPEAVGVGQETKSIIQDIGQEENKTQNPNCNGGIPILGVDTWITQFLGGRTTRGKVNERLSSL